VNETNGLAVPVPQQLPAVWGLGKEGDPDYDWVRRRLTPHPLQSYTTALTFKAPVGNNLPRTYIHTLYAAVASGARGLAEACAVVDRMEMGRSSRSTRFDDHPS